MKKINYPKEAYDIYTALTELYKVSKSLVDAVNELQEENRWLWKFHHTHDAVGRAVVPPEQTQEPERKHKEHDHFFTCKCGELHHLKCPTVPCVCEKEPECKCYHNAWEKVTRFCEAHKEKPAKKECEHNWRHVDFQGCLCDKCFITLSEYQKPRLKEAK